MVVATLEATRLTSRDPRSVPMPGQSLLDRDPAVADEWDETANWPLAASDVTWKNGNLYWWRCTKHGHTWEARVSARTRGDKCPFCSGTRVLSGFNDLETLYPALAHEWDSDVNGLLASEVLAGGKTAWAWRCDPYGHRWNASIQKRTRRGDSCPTCSNRIVLTGFNDLATWFPEIARELDAHASGFTASEVVYGTGQVAVWRCPKYGHTYSMPVVRRTHSKRTCPVCAGKQVLAGFNDLAHLHPVLATEFDASANGCRPDEVIAGSHKKYVWICTAYGHRWSATVGNRTGRHSGCAVCAGKQVCVGFNDLATLYPDLAMEWDTEANGDVTPWMVTYGSGKKRAWVCADGHKWWATPGNRTGGGTGCPDCSEEDGWGTSLAERSLRSALGCLYSGTRESGAQLAASQSRNAFWRCDIVIDAPDGRVIVVEYDGDLRGHSNEPTGTVDVRKSEDLRATGHVLVRVRVGALRPLHEHDLDVSAKAGHYSNSIRLADLVAARLARLGYPPDLIGQDEPPF